MSKEESKTQKRKKPKKKAKHCLSMWGDVYGMYIPPAVSSSLKVTNVVLLDPLIFRELYIRMKILPGFCQDDNSFANQI